MEIRSARPAAGPATIAIILVGVLVTLLVLGLGESAAAGFGEGGRLVTDFGTYRQISGSIADLAAAPDGRTAIATEGAGGEEIQVAVLDAAGSLDRSFSADGLLAPQLEPGRPFRRDPVQIAFDGSSLLLAGTVRGPRADEVEIRR